MKTAFFAVGCALVASSAWAAVPQQSQQMPQSQEQPTSAALPVNETEIVAKVLKVDKTAKTVTIKDHAKGHEVTINVPSDVYSLDTIQPGHTLDIRYLESMAVAVTKAGMPEDSQQSETLRLAPKTGIPAEVTVNTKVLNGRIQNVNRDQREIKIKGQGQTITLKAAETLQGFDAIKIGDKALLRYTEAVAIAAAPHEMSGSESTMPSESGSSSDMPGYEKGSDSQRNRKN